MTGREKLRAAAEAVLNMGLTGRWGWFGNVRHSEPYLATVRQGHRYVLGPGNRHDHIVYTPNFDDVIRIERADACNDRDCPHDHSDDGAGSVVHHTGDRVVAQNRPTIQVAVTDPAGYTRLRPAHEIPVYEIAPDATSETDPTVYRHDIIGLRSPVADYLAAADADTVLDLLDENERLRTVLADWLVERPDPICSDDHDCAHRRALTLVRGAA